MIFVVIGININNVTHVKVYRDPGAGGSVLNGLAERVSQLLKLTKITELYTYNG